MEKKAKSPFYLKEWRKHRGYTQDRLAEMTGLSKPYISQLETRKRQWTEDLLEIFAEALQCAPVDLQIRNPSQPESIWSIWEQLKPAEQTQVVEIAKTIKRTGTDG